MNTLLKDKWVKIRKPRWCFGCQGDFPIGTRMIYTVWTNDGYLNSSYMCEACDAYVQDHHEDLESGFCEGEIGTMRKEDERMRKLDEVKK